MCGIVGAIAERDITPILLEGLKRLEYRGYDSSGIAVLTESGLQRQRALGKVIELVNAIEKNPLQGHIGIAHTRWATHGMPSEANAHPHASGEGSDNSVAVVHNGIIENFEALRKQLTAKGYVFNSQTDSEVIPHLIHEQMSQGEDLLSAVNKTVAQLDGAYALAVIHQQEPERVIVVRSGSPLVIGVGIGEHFIASDQLALLPVTNRFVFLEEGDTADIRRESFTVYNTSNETVDHEIIEFDGNHEDAEKGEYRHYMLKEIYEQPVAVQKTLEAYVDGTTVQTEKFGVNAKQILSSVEAVQIIACGTSFHAGLIAKYWFEALLKIPCNVEVASEFRYRENVVLPNSLFLTISQSGETADTLAALRDSSKQGYLGSMVICNVPGSSLVRESDLNLMTNAGPEVGVASTKAFTTQLAALLLLASDIGKHKNIGASFNSENIIKEMRLLPTLLESALRLDGEIQAMAKDFGEKHHALFLGRGIQYPVAMEGALKLKEISYIHAEAYPAGELKHGPLALVDKEMPVVSVAPNDDLLEKLKSNLQEVKARGGQLYIFADAKAEVKEEEGVHVINVPHVDEILAPIMYTIPLQLLSYHVAVIKGTDVDQPRNLAKSVTVE